MTEFRTSHGKWIPVQTERPSTSLEGEAGHSEPLETTNFAKGHFSRRPLFPSRGNFIFPKGHFFCARTLSTATFLMRGNQTTLQRADQQTNGRAGEQTGGRDRRKTCFRNTCFQNLFPCRRGEHRIPPALSLGRGSVWSLNLCGV